MVGFTSVFGAAALFATYASALPRPGWVRDNSMGSGSYGSQGDSSSSSGYGTSGQSNSGYGNSGQSNSGYGSSGYGSSGYGSSGSSGYGSSGSSGYGSSGSSGNIGSGYGSKNSGASSAAMTSEVMMTSAAMATATIVTSSAMMTESVLSSDVMMTTSSVMATETMMTSAVMASETSMAEATSTAAATSSISYGSGSSNWGGDGYSNCVQQCVASYAPMATVTASATYLASPTAQVGTGTTHTIYVAPTQGVLRMVPFAVNASAGDTLYWIWGGSNHTVTKSSELSPCNKTTDGTAFATGEHDVGFTFTETVNDTNPLFYYCGTPTHCEKGMFGIVNPPSVDNNAPSSVASMMPAMMANSSTISGMYAASNISSNPAAATWGNNLDIASLPTWAQPLMAENVVYTRAFLAANPSILNADGTLNMAATNGQFNVPTDVSQSLNSAPGSSSSSASAPPASSAVGNAAAATSSSSSAASATTSTTSGSRANAASGALLGVAAIAATFLAL